MPVYIAMDELTVVNKYVLVASFESTTEEVCVVVLSLCC